MVLFVFCGVSVSAFATNVFENPVAKVEVFDFGAHLDEPVAYTAQAKPFLARNLAAHGIGLLRLNITNLSDTPIMINARSVRAEKLSPKTVAKILQRFNSITPFPYAESWAVYATWALFLRTMQWDFPGWASWIDIPWGLKVPKAPTMLCAVGDYLNDTAKNYLSGNFRHFALPAVRGYCASLWNRTINVPVISLFALIMSGRYLGAINRKNQEVLEVCQVLGGGNVRLLYPVLIQPQQTVQKLILLDLRTKDHMQKVGIDIFAKNNKDIVASFEYELHQAAGK
jgi:hypothetical protein